MSLKVSGSHLLTKHMSEGLWVERLSDVRLMRASSESGDLSECELSPW